MKFTRSIKIGSKKADTILKLEFEDAEPGIEFATTLTLLDSLNHVSRQTTATYKDYIYHAGKKLIVSLT